MAYSLLFIEEKEHTLLDAARQAAWAAQGFSCRSTVAASVFDQPATLKDADLIVFVAGDETDSAPRFLSSLSLLPVRPPIIIIIPAIASQQVIAAVSRDADDFLLWRCGTDDELLARIRRMLPRCDLRPAARRLTESAALSKLVGQDPGFLSMLSKIPLLARTQGTVLVIGETGCGKELCARALHNLSPRRDYPFIPVDCGALPELLIENELFGHVKGAFTDAHRDQVGLLAMAERGTLFLDEVDSLSLSAQAKLLRFMEERVYRQLGADRFSSANVRIIAATNADLERLVREKRFRADLYFRVSALQLHVPPLRERRGDVELLARFFVARVCCEAGMRKTLTQSAIDVLSRAPWPGNVRQLFNVVQAAVLLREGPVVLPAHLNVSEPTASESDPPTSFTRAKAAAVASFERCYLEDLMRKHGGNVTHSAHAARKDRRAFGRLLKKHNIDRESFQG
jgi:two-component system response regulator GlrR